MTSANRPSVTPQVDSVHRAGHRSDLDPDVLAGLEREREFLLRSLDDLDAELRAGDLEPNDHAALSDDYTRRLAELSRSITEQRAAFSGADTKLSNRQRIVTIVAVVTVAVLAGVLLARASGFRTPDESVTGGIRQSSTGLLAEADTLTREGRWPEAVKIYNDVLQVSPGNAEALTYRGWLTARLGDNDTGLVDLGEAVAVDPAYPDARVFSAIVLDDEQRFDEAAEQIQVLDTLEVPDEMLGLISASNLRGSVTAGQIKQRFDPLEPGDVVDLSEITATLDDAARAGALLTQLGDVLLAQAVFSAVLEDDADQLIALVGKGQLAREPELWSLDSATAEDALDALDRAVELAEGLPEESVIRLYRTDARTAAGDLEAARDDLATVVRDDLSADLQALYDDLTTTLN